MNKTKCISIGIASAIMFLSLFNISSFSNNCKAVRNDTIRLHIIASSDSKPDQEVKYKVRDKILESSPEIFDGSVNIENAVEKIIPQINKIRTEADKILIENGLNYKSDVILTREYFDTRVYENGLKLPAGEYLALKITLGNAHGENWWCIMFPALCLPAVNNSKNIAESYYSVEECDMLINSNNYEVRFKIVEIIEKIKNMVDIDI